MEVPSTQSLCQSAASPGTGEGEEAKEGRRGQRQPPWVAGLTQLLSAPSLDKDMKVNNDQDFLVSFLSNPCPRPGSAGNSRHIQRRQNFPGDAFHDDPVYT